MPSGGYVKKQILSSQARFYYIFYAGTVEDMFTTKRYFYRNSPMNFFSFH